MRAGLSAEAVSEEAAPAPEGAEEEIVEAELDAADAGVAAAEDKEKAVADKAVQYDKWVAYVEDDSNDDEVQLARYWKLIEREDKKRADAANSARDDEGPIAGRRLGGGYGCRGRLRRWFPREHRRALAVWGSCGSAEP